MHDERLRSVSTGFDIKRHAAYRLPKAAIGDYQSGVTPESQCPKHTGAIEGYDYRFRARKKRASALPFDFQMMFDRYLSGGIVDD